MKFISKGLLALILTLAPLTTLAHGLGVASLEITEVSPAEYRAIYQVSGTNEGLPQLIWPKECQTVGLGLKQDIRQGVRQINTWQCKQPLENLPIDWQGKQQFLQFYLQWQGLEKRVPLQLIGQFPIVINELQAAQASRTTSVHTYFPFGITHILTGADHLLLIAGLILLVAGFRQLFIAITGFTVGHSITLALVALGVVQINTLFIEAIIALSLVFLFAELLKPDKSNLIRRRPATLSIGFGLLHGLGFASALVEIGLPEQGKILALLLFNLGVEFGQLVFIVFLWPLLYLVKTKLPALQFSWGYRASGFVAGYWVIERIANF